MGIKRIVDTAFWTDRKIENFTADERYFYLYLLTGPFTTQLGIYEASLRHMAFHLGYGDSQVRALLEKFERDYGLILWSGKTGEVAVLNFLKHSVVKGGYPVRDQLVKELRRVKDKSLIDRVFAHVEGAPNLNATVRALIEEYRQTGGDLCFSYERGAKERTKEKNEKENENDNDNENENDVSGVQSLRESTPDTGGKKREKKKNLFFKERKLDPEEEQAVLRMMERIL